MNTHILAARPDCNHCARKSQGQQLTAVRRAAALVAPLLADASPTSTCVERGAGQDRWGGEQVAHALWLQACTMRQHTALDLASVSHINTRKLGIKSCAWGSPAAAAPQSS